MRTWTKNAKNIFSRSHGEHGGNADRKISLFALCLSERAGFSLLEMLAVMTVIAILAALILPAAGTISRGMEMTRAGTLLVDQFQAALQQATSSAKSSELRFYQMARPGSPQIGFRAMQIMVLDERGETAAPVSAVSYLPGPILLHSAVQYSPMLVNALRSGTASLPGVGNCAYKALRFRPGGAPEMSGSNSFVTAVFELDLLAGKAPANFACVKIQSVTGKPIVYRP